MKVTAKTQRALESRIASAEGAVALLMRDLRAILNSMTVVMDPSSDAIEKARLDAWCDALQAIGTSEVLEAHEELRRALLDDIEARCHRYLLIIAGQPEPTP